MFPETTPFNSSERKALEPLLASFSAEQRAWLGGFLSASSGASAAAAPAASASLNVLFGTESGNSEALAEKLAKSAKKQGFKVKNQNLADISPADLAKMENIALIVSTWGDGEPPEAAEGFYNEFMKASVDLSKVSFSICALGDTSYDKFCQTGKDFDAQLEKLGAKRIADRVDCDVDFDDAYEAWEKSVFSALGSAATSAVAAPAFSAAPAVEYGRKNPFPSEVLENLVLNGEGSAKETIHVELNLEGSGLDYEAGDALAVVPLNADDTVAEVLKASGLKGDESVELKGAGSFPLTEALTAQLDITALSRAVVKKYQALSGDEKLAALLADDAKEEFKNWCWGRQVVDLLEEFPVKDLTAQQLVSVMRKLPPRLYSIASSPKAHPGEVHLTVAAVRYDAHGKSRKGVASTYLADDCSTGEKVQVYVHKNKNFRLPEDDSKPVIMVGPGTGIAPFRAFIEERAEREAKGDTWLFFGDQRYTYDFLYQLELQDHLKNGDLNKLDVAFSRDQPEKVYVQDRMRENAAELYEWLEKGAYFYVCGDASRMASDVHDALIDVVATQGGKTQEEVTAYVDALKKDKRYQRDVY